MKQKCPLCKKYLVFCGIQLIILWATVIWFCPKCNTVFQRDCKSHTWNLAKYD